MADTVRVAGYRGELSNVEILTEGDPSLPNGPDLAAMAEAALGYLTRNPDPENGYDARFTLFPHRCPPFAPEVTAALMAGAWQRRYERAGHIDPVAIADTESRNDIAFGLMREMAGSETGRQVEEIVHRRLVAYVRYGEGRPGDDMCWAPPFSLFADVEGDYAMVWTTAMLLRSEADRFRLSGDEVHRHLGRRLFEGLQRVASWDAGRAYYPHGVAPFRDGVAVAGAYAGHYPNVISPLVHYGVGCSDAEALVFAEAMAEGFLADLQPGHQHKADGHIHGHSHLQMHAVRGVAHLGAVTGNGRFLDWATRAYDVVHGAGFDSGWTPEIHWDADHRDHSETCLVADLLETEVWLARAGRPEMWDRVERTVRNYLMPAQFSVTGELECFWRGLNHNHSEAELAAGLAGLRELEGGFLGGLTPNDRVIETRLDEPHHGTDLYEGRQVRMEMPGCCPPSGMRALHLAWANTVVRDGNEVYVHLAFDRQAPEATVVSGLPRRGCLEVTARVAGDFWLRPPTWAPRAQVEAWLGDRRGEGQRGEDRRVDCRWGGPGLAYVGFAGVRSGDRLALRWPLVRFRQRLAPRFLEDSEAEYARSADGPSYTFEWTGSTLTAIEPAGVWLPWCR